jgi:hypothetical protein
VDKNNDATEFNPGDKVYIKREVLNDLESSISMREILEKSYKMTFSWYSPDFLTEPAKPYY